MNRTRMFRNDTVLVISLVVGIICGAAIGSGLGSRELVTVYSSGVYNSGTDWVSAFISYFLGSASFVTAAFFMGFGALSHPLELMLAAFKGLGLGVLARSIYSCNDIAVRMALFLPFAVLSSGVLILQLCESLEMSTRYLSMSVTAENRLGMAKEFRDYIFRFLIYVVACAALSALNCLALRGFDYLGFI